MEKVQVSDKFTINYETLFINHKLLTGFHDCLLIVPSSSFTLFYDMVKGGLELDYYNENEKVELIKFYKPFIDVILRNPQIINEIKQQNKKQSSAICLSTEDNLYLCFTGSFKNENLTFSEEASKNLDEFDYDVLNTCTYFDCLLFSTREELADIINSDKLKIDVVVPVVEESEEDNGKLPDKEDKKVIS